ENGGQVFVLATEADTIFGPSLQIARNPGSTGRVTVDGAGQAAGETFIEISTPNPVDPVDGFGPQLQVGRSGDGTLTIQNEGEVRVLGEDAYVTVSRGNANEFNNPGDAPGLAQSHLNILAGGSLVMDGVGISSNMSVGREANGNGAVLVSGAGSSLSMTGQHGSLLIGRDGSGEVTIEQGGLFETTFV
ncbi:MAG: hypothetical protein GY778_09540, partial [bacterium]|nr:hypothetical protein [bacterium]